MYSIVCRYFVWRFIYPTYNGTSLTAYITCKAKTMENRHKKDIHCDLMVYIDQCYLKHNIVINHDGVDYFVWRIKNEEELK